MVKLLLFSLLLWQIIYFTFEDCLWVWNHGIGYTVTEKWWWRQEKYSDICFLCYGVTTPIDISSGSASGMCLLVEFSNMTFAPSTNNAVYLCPLKFFIKTKTRHKNLKIGA